jgi:serine/threonine protein phosphatase PrpC
VKEGDIFIMGTDGLWDNLYTVKILDILRPFIRSADILGDPELIAELIC